MDSTILIGLFRIAQEAFEVALRREAVSSVKLSVESTEHALMVQVADDGKHTAADAKRDMASGPMLSVFHRVRLLKGEAVMLNPPGGGSVFRVTIPLVGNEL